MFEQTSFRKENNFTQPMNSINDIKKLFGTEVKWKRVLKELSDIDLLEQNPQFEITPIGLRIPIVHETDNKTYRFEIRIDNNYPFTKPQVHSLDNIWRYGEARNLLELGLQEGEQWDYGFTFSDIKTMVPKIVQSIETRQGLLGKYHLFEKYFRQELSGKGLDLFKVTETKKKMLIKHNEVKIIGFGKTTFLKFQIKQSYFVLDLNLLISEIIQIKRKQQSPFDLKIFYKRTGSDKQQHFKIICESQQDLKNILFHFNPISTIQQIVLEQQNNEQEPQNQTITNLSTLISFYADKNKDKSEKYLKRLQKVITKQNDDDKY